MRKSFVAYLNLSRKGIQKDGIERGHGGGDNFDEFYFFYINILSEPCG
jgi:hypothetical protein